MKLRCNSSDSKLEAEKGGRTRHENPGGTAPARIWLLTILGFTLLSHEMTAE